MKENEKKRRGVVRIAGASLLLVTVLGNAKIPEGACCFTDKPCEDLTTDECRAQDGNPSGPGYCESVECPEACCFLDLPCSNLTPSVCVERGGTAMGEGVSCTTPSLCLEACCFYNGSCEYLTSLTCIKKGGDPSYLPGLLCDLPFCDLVPGHCDPDHDVDLLDFAYFVSCFTGPDNGPIETDCECADMDGDDDVDLLDVAEFQKDFTGDGN